MARKKETRDTLSEAMQSAVIFQARALPKDGGGSPAKSADTNGENAMLTLKM